MNLHSMKRTKAEKKSTSDEATPVGYDETEDYPYGLEISLEKESLEKLGLNIEDFTVGGKVDIVCQAEVTRLHQSVSKRNDAHTSASIQITDMAMMARPNEKPKKLKDILSVIKS